MRSRTRKDILQISKTAQQNTPKSRDIKAVKTRYRVIEKERPDSNVVEILHDGMWKDNPCYIIGGGESVKKYDLSKLRNSLVIGINRAFEFIDPAIIFSMDGRFWSWIEKGEFGEETRERFISYKHGLKVWLNTGGMFYPADILQVRCSGNRVWSYSLEDGIGSGGNSGFAALNLAWLLGARPIYLLGYDMKGDGSRQKWFHDGYPIVQPESVYHKFKSSFEKYIPKEVCKDVINCNLESNLNIFERRLIDMEEEPLMPLFVSFYTKGTGYENEAKKLIASLRAFGIRHEVDEIDSRGSWINNVRYKVDFILNKLITHKRDIVWVDADAIINRRPVLLRNLKNLSAHFRLRKDGTKELLTGTLFVPYTEQAIEIMRAWKETTETMPDTWEQKTLQGIYNACGGNGFDILPKSYCHIFDSGGDVSESHIVHYQASRQYKRVIT